MNRRSTTGRLLGSVAVLVGSMALGRLAVPVNVFACYCAPDPIADYVDDPDVVVVTGVATGPYYDGSFEIHRVFKGTFASDRMPIRGGSDAECLLPYQVNREILIVANLRQGRLVPSACLPFTYLDFAYGYGEYAKALAAFGPGRPTSLGYPLPTERGFVDVFIAGGVLAAGQLLQAPTAMSAR